jgi:hypothetical protein
MSGYGQANTWSTGPTTLPSWENTPSKAYFNGYSNGRTAANNGYTTPSLYSNSSNATTYNKAFNKGHQDQFQSNMYGQTLQRSKTNYGGTYRRKNRKTRKTMRKRSYRRRR